MKKNFVRLGVLAAALALALVFAACEQPTDEGSSGPGSPTIIRLYLDREEGTLTSGDSLEIRVGKQLYVQAANYPYAETLDVNGNSINGTAGDGRARTNANGIFEADRTNKLAIPAGRTGITAGDSVLQSKDPRQTFLSSGVRTVVSSVTSIGDSATGLSIQVNPKNKEQYYIDIPLINLTPAAADFASVYSGSVSGYVELAVTINSMYPALTFTTMYTKDKLGFNDILRMENGSPVFRVNNANIKTVSLKRGVNELYLSYFTNVQGHEPN